MADHIFRFTVWQDNKGRDYATCGELSADSRASATAKLARQIVALDCVPDGPIHCYNRAGKLAYTIRSLHRWAMMTIVEDDKSGIRAVKWKPSPFAKDAA